MQLDKFAQAKIMLLVYSLKYSWVKKMAIENNIDLNFGFSNKCDVLEILDCINIIKQEDSPLYQKFKNLKKQLVKTNNINKQYEIAKQILELQKVMEEINGGN